MNIITRDIKNFELRKIFQKSIMQILNEASFNEDLSFKNFKEFVIRVTKANRE